MTTLFVPFQGYKERDKKVIKLGQSIASDLKRLQEMDILLTEKRSFAFIPNTMSSKYT